MTFGLSRRANQADLVGQSIGAERPAHFVYLETCVRA